MKGRGEDPQFDPEVPHLLATSSSFSPDYPKQKMYKVHRKNDGVSVPVIPDITVTNIDEYNHDEGTDIHDAIPIVTPPPSPPRVSPKRNRNMKFPNKGVTFRPLSLKTKDLEDVTTGVKSNRQPKNSSPPPSTPTTAASTPNSTIITLHQSPSEKKKQEKDRGMIMSFVFRQKKIILSLLLAYAVLATGAGGYMLKQLLRIPGLDNQIQELRNEVNRLETQVKTLQNTNDQLESNIDQLNQTNNRLETNILTLKDENSQFESLVNSLNETNKEMDRLNDDLKLENERYQDNNEQLENHNIFLANHLNNTKAIADNLTEEVNMYTLLVGELRYEIDMFKNSTTNLTWKVGNLTVQVTRLNGENEQLQNTTNHLLDIVTFLNETSIGFNQTLSSVTDFLDGQIYSFRNIRMNNQHILYNQIVTDWDCAVLSRFRLRDFVNNYYEPIGSNDIDDVLDYVDERVLSELCINRTDFEHSLQTSMFEPPQPLQNISMAELETAVAIYTTKVLDYYFPDEGESDGLVESDWSAAQYDCTKLTTPPFQF